MTRAELDPNLKQAAAIGTPVEVVDPATNELFYLVSAEQFRLLAASISDDFDPSKGYPIIDQTMAADDAHDPVLDRYQHVA